MASVQRLTTCLAYPGTAEEAVTAYCELFDDARVVNVMRHGAESPLPEGTAMLVEFELFGTRLVAINGQPDWKFTDACSLLVACADQDEIDRYWNGIESNGGEPLACGWIRDRHGLSWQLVPQRFLELMESDDAAGKARMMQAMYTMVKLDAAALEAAFTGA